MRFIKHALIGIALYEAVRYILNKVETGPDLAHEGTQAVTGVNQQFRTEDVNVIAGARQTDQLDRMKENAVSGGNSASGSDQEDPWKKSLANDELRAPDS